jgi:predicted secreted protein
MPRSCMPSNVATVLFGIIFALECFTLDAAAQGFPGGGGHGGGRGGAHTPPSGAKSQNPTPVQAAADPLATFLGSLHALRMEILVRQEQVEDWTTMQDALRAYVDQEQNRDSATDPVLRLRNLAADARARADALQKVSDSMTALVGTLDDHQRQTFASRLGDAFAGGSPRAP